MRIRFSGMEENIIKHAEMMKSSLSLKGKPISKSPQPKER